MVCFPPSPTSRCNTFIQRPGGRCHMGKMRTLRISLLIGSLVCFISSLAAPVFAQTETDCTIRSAAQQQLPINAAVIWDCLHAGQPVDVEGVEIEGDLDLTSLWEKDSPGIVPITVPLKITGSHFTGSLIGIDWDREVTVSFEEAVDLRSTHFDGRVDLSSAQFKRAANFLETRFGDMADFTQVTFSLGASFNRAQFGGEAVFFLAQFSGGSDFMEAHFAQSAYFQQAQFVGDSDAFFFKTRFGGPAWFTDARFAAPAVFLQAEFTGTVQFDGALFQDKASFRQATFRRKNPDDTVSFSRASLATLDLNNAQFEGGQLDLSNTVYQSLLALNFNPAVLAAPEDLDVRQTILRNLEANFRSLGLVETANEIVYWRSHAERAAKPLLAQVLELIFLDWPFGYGVRPLHTIALSIVMILMFAIFYYPAGAIRSAPIAPPKPRERKLALRLSEIPVARDDEIPDLVKPNRPPRRTFPRLTRAWQAVAFSFSVFTKIGWGERVAVRAAAVVVIEWVLGLVMIAGLFFSLANTIPLLNALLRSIF